MKQPQIGLFMRSKAPIAGRVQAAPPIFLIRSGCLAQEIVAREIFLWPKRRVKWEHHLQIGVFIDGARLIQTEPSYAQLCSCSFVQWGSQAAQAEHGLGLPELQKIWGFPARHGGTPIAGWFIRENPSKMDDDWG